MLNPRNQAGTQSSPWIRGMAVAALAAWGLLHAPAKAGAWERYEFTQLEMAIPVRIVLYASTETDAIRGAQAVYANFNRLNSVFSDYDPQSELRQMTARSGPGQPVAVSADLFEVLRRAQEISEATDGAFDVTVAPLVRLWRRSKRQRELPSPQRLAEAKALVGYRNVRLDPERRTVELSIPGVQIDLGGIATGYAVDQSLEILRKMGFNQAMIDASGDVGALDPPPGQPGWRIGVVALDPTEKPSEYLWLANASLTTSGDAFQYVLIDGHRYSHIVDPKTGLGLTNHSVVTVIAPTTLLADAWATAFSVLGPKQGLAQAERLPGVAVLFLQVSEEGKVESFANPSWKNWPRAETPVPQ